MHTCIFRQDRQACQQEPNIVVVELGSEDLWSSQELCTWNVVNLCQTQVWLTLKTVKSSGLILLTSDS